MNMVEIEAYGIALVPVIVGLVELFKGIGLSDKLAPVASLVFGILAGIFYASPDDLLGGVLIGIALGLSAIGLYSGTKNTIEKSDV